jgi:pimeloyl-ACP methyl ester carboxylesterase
LIEERRMRAREPDRVGYVEREGVRVAWKVYGEAERPQDPAVLLLPAWCIVSSECWKMQVPFLSRRTRVVTYDPRGNGLSDRPSDPGAYRREELARDTVDVLHATGTQRVVAVGFSAGNMLALDLVCQLPERVVAWVAIAPYIPDLGAFPEERASAFDTWEQDTGVDEGWGRHNRYSWIRDYRGFAEFFFGELASEPHSTKLFEDFLGWSAATDGATLVRAEVADLPGPRTVEEQCASVRCPVVVVHGTEDRIIPYDHGVRLAELTGGSLVTFEGSGHAPHARDPVAVNRVLDEVLTAWAGSGALSRAQR